MQKVHLDEWHLNHLTPSNPTSFPYKGPFHIASKSHCTNDVNTVHYDITCAPEELPVATETALTI